MKKATDLEKNVLNESSNAAMVKALQDLESAWNYVLKIWSKDENVEDIMMRSDSIYPFGETAMEDIEIGPWIKACIRALRNTK